MFFVLLKQPDGTTLRRPAFERLDALERRNVGACLTFALYHWSFT
jgi:hypothetical protein